LAIAQPWRATVDASLQLMDDVDEQIQAINKQLRQLSPEHRYMPLLMTVPAIGFVLSYTTPRRSATSPAFRRPTSSSATRPMPARQPVR
jgi:hypothetical protein